MPSELIPSYSGELKPFSHGFRLYETLDEPKQIVRLRSVESLIDQMRDNERAWAGALEVPNLRDLDSTKRLEAAAELVGTYEQELEELESWGVITPEHHFWFDKVKDEDTLVCATKKISGEHIGRAFDEDTEEFDFDRLPPEIWRNYGQVMSGLIGYYENVSKREKFFIHDLADPRQWVYDEYDRQILLVDVDPTAAYFQPTRLPNHIEVEVKAHESLVRQLVRAGYMPAKDKLRLSRLREDLVKLRR